MKINRRVFTAVSSIGAMGLASGISRSYAAQNTIRLGGPVFKKYENPEEWVKNLKELGYSAAYCPVGIEATDDVVNAYIKASKEGNIIISEVGRLEQSHEPQ